MVVLYFHGSHSSLQPKSCKQRSHALKHVKDLKSEVTWGNERSQFGGLNRTSCGARLIVQEADCTLLCCLCRSRLLWGRLLLCMWFMQNMRYWLYIYVWFVPNHEILTVLLCVVSSVLWYVVCAKPWNTDCIVICGLCRTKALVLELLAAVCLVSGGHDIILSAFDNFKEVRNLQLISV